jgi:Ca-activated chloride channel family protein
MIRKSIRRKLARGGWPVALACVALAAGGIVLLRAPGHATPRDMGHTGTGGTSAVPAGPTRIDLHGPSLNGHFALSQSAVLANGARNVLAELRLTAPENAEAARDRQPVALAVVLDVSGSMMGEKIEQAKSSVRQLVDRMHDDDWVSLTTYDHTTYVLQPLARVGSVRGELYARIAGIQSGGGTSIPQALETGAASLDGAPGHLMRRIVLLSDGLDGSGLPLEGVRSQIRTRASRGVATSSLGIGTDYDEAFMTAVADAGRGNYEFLASASQLQRFLHRELEQASTTVVDGVAAIVTLPPGMRLNAVHGAESAAVQMGQTRISFGPLYAGESRRAVLDIAVDAGSPGAIGSLGARVEYRTVANDSRHEIAGAQLALVSVPTDAEVTASRDEAIYGETWAVVIDARQREAVTAWRAGDVTRAQQIAQRNVQQARIVATEAPAAAPALEQAAAEYEADTSTFGSLGADSEEGRSYGLRSNAARRGRAGH